MDIILASASPRRKELLEGLKVKFTVIPSGADETVCSSDPEMLVRELSARKALDVYSSHPDSLVIGSDTVVAADGEILGKPKNEQDARRMLALLSGKTHEVFTGVSVVFPDGSVSTDSCRSAVAFKKLEPWEIDAYTATGEYTDKAGSYAIQGRAAVFVEKIEGCYSNIVGLPLPTLYRMLGQKGVNLWEQTI